MRAAARLSQSWFLVGMVAAVALATLTPELGRSGGPLRADALTDAGIVAIFFLHGAALSPERLLAGAARWRLHAFVQVFTFAVFPLLGVALRAAAGDLVPPDLAIGLLYLCALPSTITSSVAMTAVARGNVVAALFNATLSSLAGVLLTPLLVGALVGAAGQVPLGAAMAKTARLLLAPLAAGLLAHRWLGGLIARHHRLVTRFDRVVVLSIVYVSFCDSVRAGLWTRYGGATIALAAGGAALILAAVLLLTWRGARLLGFGVEDEIVAIFCGSTKALAVGIPMAKALFGGHPGLGVIVLPIMLYHQLQLFTCSALAERYAGRRPAP